MVWHREITSHDILSISSQIRNRLEEPLYGSTIVHGVTNYLVHRHTEIWTRLGNHCSCRCLIKAIGRLCSPYTNVFSRLQGHSKTSSKTLSKPRHGLSTQMVGNIYQNLEGHMFDMPWQHKVWPWHWLCIINGSLFPSAKYMNQPKKLSVHFCDARLDEPFVFYRGPRYVLGSRQFPMGPWLTFYRGPGYVLGSRQFPMGPWLTRQNM